MIKLDSISKIYETPEGPYQALKNVSFSFHRTGFYGISGVSGAGKTTILSIIGLLDEPTNGIVEIDGIEVNDGNLTTIRSKYISFVFQKETLLKGYSVYENLRLVTDNEEQIDFYLKRIRLDDAKNAFVNELSGGEKQRVAFIRTLLEDRPILLLDEPTGNLDKKNAKIVMDILKEESKRKLVIMVSHNTELLDEYSDSRLLIENKGLTISKEIDSNSDQSSAIIGDRKINKPLLFKCETRRNISSSIANTLALVVISFFMSISSYSAFYSTRTGAKSNGEIGDVILACKEHEVDLDADYHKTVLVRSGKTLNDKIASTFDEKIAKKCFVIQNNLPVVFSSDSNLSANDIIVSSRYYREYPYNEGYKVGDSISFANLTFNVKEVIDSPCFYISSENESIISTYKKKHVRFIDSADAESTSTSLVVFNDSYRLDSNQPATQIQPASTLGITLENNQAVFGFKGSGSQFYYHVDRQGINAQYWESCLDMRMFFPKGIQYINKSTLGIDMSLVKDNILYVNDSIYDQISSIVSGMNLDEYALFNDNDRVVDFILDNELKIGASMLRSEKAQKLDYYILNIGSGTFYLKGMFDFVFYAFLLIYVLYNVTIVVNTTKERKYTLGILDIAGVKRIESLVYINYKTIISSLICLVASVVITSGGWFVGYVNGILSNLGFAANFLYVSPAAAIFVAVMLLLAPIVGLALSLLRLRSTTTKRIFDIEE